ncbi:LacI family DNA-binding transcriptional regulator [Atopobacter phocae]|uniref:LacI family DNA-binding transcriptional regulator n=1 Tax=Atopobacter phocae TaxID=136492 RepID=UPI000472D649|nr:LacI family DNA-binding transcriptional regulator [Atopobacter phocae]
MVTLSDIAKMANVSKSTVSRYLNNGSISEKTKKKLDKIVHETGYQPNALAQSLKASQSNMVGVIIPRYDSTSTNQVLKGIDSISYEKNIQLMITNTNLNLKRTKENISLLQRQKVGAIILFATEIDKELEKQIKLSNIPIFIIGQQINNCPSFIYKDYEAGKIIAKHAIEQGHKKLLFVGVTEKDYSVGVLRKKGFYEVAEKNNASIEFIETGFSRSYSYEKSLDFLPKIKATYIAAATDHIAIGISNACAKLGISIPEDVSLSGFGGYSIIQNVYPHITTVTYPFSQMGEIVMKRVIQVLDKGTENIDKLTELQVNLNVQGSTKKI